MAMPPTASERFERGREIFDTVTGASGQKLFESLQDIAPDLANHMIAFGFGDVYAGPGLQLCERQLVTLSILTTLGDCEPQLEVHIRGALRVGLTAEAIVETIVQTAVYAGFPRSLNAMKVARKVFDEQGLLPIVARIGLS